MKKKILSGIFTLSLLVATSYGVNQSVKDNTDLSYLALSNVEALAQGEVNPWDCYYTPNVCILGNGWVYFGNRIW
ncbi:NVEALA protein [Porphyromonadaceae bacterium KH3CP3RA]|nr:NVEALA protein [Porphyromonadaceae bacterium KH3CP3RA]